MRRRVDLLVVVVIVMVVLGVLRMQRVRWHAMRVLMMTVPIVRAVVVPARERSVQLKETGDAAAVQVNDVVFVIDIIDIIGGSLRCSRLRVGIAEPGGTAPTECDESPLQWCW